MGNIGVEGRHKRLWKRVWWGRKQCRWTR